LGGGPVDQTVITGGRWDIGHIGRSTKELRQPPREDHVVDASDGGRSHRERDRPALDSATITR